MTTPTVRPLPKRLPDLTSAAPTTSAQRLVVYRLGDDECMVVFESRSASGYSPYRREGDGVRVVFLRPDGTEDHPDARYGWAAPASLIPVRTVGTLAEQRAARRD